MPAVKHVLLVGNPTAQSGKNAARIEKAQRTFVELGARCETFPTLPRGATVPALRERLDREGCDVVVAMGGDGTFREVGAALLGSSRRASIAMGMLPTGTANDQGKSFGIEASEWALERNVAIALGDHETRLDAGHLRAHDEAGAVLHEGVFFDSAGWGLMARVLGVRNEDRAVVEELGPLKALYRDQLVYAGAFARTFLASYVERDKFTAEIEADGEVHRFSGLTDLVVKGTRVYAGAWVFDPTSRHDDGLFELVPFVGKRDWASKALLHVEGNPLTEKLLNLVGIEHSRGFRFRQLSMRLVPEGEVAVSAQMDGEEIPGAERFSIDVEKEALRLVVPRRPDA
jgi:diacylglycerol kinase family enzyme